MAIRSYWKKKEVFIISFHTFPLQHCAPPHWTCPRHPHPPSTIPHSHTKYTLPSITKTCTTIPDPTPPTPSTTNKEKNQSFHLNNANAKELHIQVPICHMAPTASVPQEHLSASKLCSAYSLSILPLQKTQWICHWMTEKKGVYHRFVYTYSLF